ncbi:MAG: hypothetical protein ABIP90_13115 [Vicinamibacterales bacterium]
MFLPQTPQPFMVEIIRPPTEQQTIADLFVNSLGLAGAFAVAAIPLGLVAGFLLIRWNARRRPDADHMPHVSPSVELDEPTDRPSSPVR